LNIKIKPAANLSKLEEVLVLVEKQERQATAENGVRVRAADILAQRLPSVPDKPAADAAAVQGASKPATKPAANGTAPKPTGTASTAVSQDANNPSTATKAPNAPAANGTPVTQKSVPKSVPKSVAPAPSLVTEPKPDASQTPAAPINAQPKPADPATPNAPPPNSQPPNAESSPQ
jgi:hypothetical protein